MDSSIAGIGGAMDCGIRNDGTLACWGAGTVASPPAGQYSGISVLVDGSLKCWNSAGASGPFPGGFESVTIGAGVCATQPDRSVRCFDYSGNPLLAPSGAFDSIDLGPPLSYPLGSVSCGVRPDGTAECWNLYE
jgi:hypothetical protein